MQTGIGHHHCATNRKPTGTIPRHPFCWYRRKLTLAGECFDCPLKLRFKLVPKLPCSSKISHTEFLRCSRSSSAPITVSTVCPRRSRLRCPQLSLLQVKFYTCWEFGGVHPLQIRFNKRALASPAKEHPMTTRIPASQRTREGLTALIEGRLSTASAKDELVKLATRLIMEEALEAEAGDAVGRDYYEHGALPGQGYRNGYRTGRLKTAEGLMEYSAPQIAGRDEPFRSAIRQHLKGHTQGLEDLAIEMLARGLSVRDIEDAFRDEDGRLLLSKTAVSQLGERLWEEYQAFAQRDLSEYEIGYLFVDGIAERLRPGAKREPVLAAWGFTVEGRRVLLHLMAGSKEDAETVTAFFEDMKGRGLNDPLLVTSDGAPGIIKAIEVCFPRAARNAALPIACAIWWSRSRKTCGRSSRSACRRPIRRRCD